MSPNKDLVQALTYFSQTADPKLAGEIAQKLVNAKVQGAFREEDRSYTQTTLGKISFPLWKTKLAAAVLDFLNGRNARTAGGIDIGGLDYLRTLGAIKDIVEQAV